MIDTGLAQAVVDGFGAAGLLAYAAGLAARRDPVAARLKFVFAAAGAFYGLRALFHATGLTAFEPVTLVMANLLPLAALVAGEGLLRRHAPRWMKLLMAGGAAAGVLAAVLVQGRLGEDFDRWLMLYVLAGLAAVVGLVGLRDRASLSARENAGLDAVGRGLLALAVLAATDFGLVSPVGLSALGALGLAYAAGASAGWRASLRDLAVVSVMALGLAVGVAGAAGVADPAAAFRLFAMSEAALLALSLLFRLQAGQGQRRRRAFLHALARADAGDLPRFLEELARQPLLNGLVLAEGTALADYDAAVLTRAFAERPVWSAGDLRRSGLDPDVREQLSDLLARNAAAHAVLVSAEPLRLALTAAGGYGRMEDDEADLLVFQKLASMVASGARA